MPTTCQAHCCHHTEKPAMPLPGLDAGSMAASHTSFCWLPASASPPCLIASPPQLPTALGCQAACHCLTHATTSFHFLPVTYSSSSSACLSSVTCLPVSCHMAMSCHVMFTGWLTHSHNSYYTHIVAFLPLLSCLPGHTCLFSLPSPSHERVRQAEPPATHTLPQLNTSCLLPCFPSCQPIQGHTRLPLPAGYTGHHKATGSTTGWLRRLTAQAACCQLSASSPCSHWDCFRCLLLPHGSCCYCCCCCCCCFHAFHSQLMNTHSVRLPPSPPPSFLLSACLAGLHTY